MAAFGGLEDKPTTVDNPEEKRVWIKTEPDNTVIV